MWQPPTFPGAGTPDGAPPQPEAAAPQGAPVPSWDSTWAQGPGGWAPQQGVWPPPPPGAWWPPQPPVRPRRSRRFVVAVVVGSVLAVLAVAALVIGAFAAGQASASGAGSSSVTTRPPVDSTGLGNDPDLDAEAARCHDGDMQSCDALFEDSTPMSRYEQYGMTCGGRVKPYDVNYCTDLD